MGTRGDSPAELGSAQSFTQKKGCQSPASVGRGRGDKPPTPQCPHLLPSHTPKISLRPSQLQTHFPEQRVRAPGWGGGCLG